MEPSIGNESARTRLLGLGNEILADDAFGILVAREIERRIPRQIDVVCSSAAGFNLMEDMLGVSRLIVVDTIVTGAAKPGTLYVLSVDQIGVSACVAPHFLGLAEVLAVGRRLRLNVPETTVLIAAEAADCATIGGAMHPDVRSAISGAVDMVRRFAANGRH
jgi:hydrogenase maturation protease